MKERMIPLVLFLGFCSHTSAAENRAAVRDEWLEAAYGLNYSSPYTVTELRETSVYGWRLAGNVSAFRWLSIVGSYDYQMYDTDDAFGVRTERYRYAKYGLQTHAPLGDHLQVLVQGTRQERYFDGITPDVSTGTSTADRYTTRGFGYLGGVRWWPTDSLEFDASYERAPLKLRYGSYDVQERFSTVDVSLVAPITSWLKLALTLEKATYTDSVDELQVSQKSRNENFLLGFRYAL